MCCCFSGSGDFYEMSFEDAKTAAGILNVALTKRSGLPICRAVVTFSDGHTSVPSVFP
jgi:DNA mismatch repair protein MutS